MSTKHATRQRPATAAPEPDQYFLRRSPAEYDRLRAQAKVWQETTERVLAKSGLMRGMSCLDAGAGPGDVMRLMGSIVGKEGHVLGVDNDQCVHAEALRGLSLGDGEIYQFAHADLTTAATINGAPFDYIFARLLLIHLPDPCDLLRRFWSWLRCGGTLCVMDYDIALVGIFPETSPANRAIEVINEASRRTGKHDRFGSRLPLLFQEAGVGFPDGTDYSSRFEPIAHVAPMLRALLKSLQTTICATGTANETELAELDAMLIAEGRSLEAYGLWPGMAAVWKRKPDSNVGANGRPVP